LGSILKPNIDFNNIGIGGLKNELEELRRIILSRLFDADGLKKLGIRHVKGVLLYGPPGVGKPICVECYPKV